MKPTNEISRPPIVDEKDGKVKFSDHVWGFIVSARGDGIVGVVLTGVDASFIQFFAPGGLPTFILDKKTGRTTLAIEPSQEGHMIGRLMGIMLRAGAKKKQPRGDIE